MTERASKVAMGVFVVFAIAALIASVFLISSGGLFTPKSRFVIFFDTSIRGLIVGSPVNFMGVRVGKVVSIQISTTYPDITFKTPVIIELEGGAINAVDTGTGLSSLIENEKLVNVLIEKGLRAQLGMQSVVTGQLSVNLDMVPDAPPVNPDLLDIFEGYYQIPSVTSPLDAVLASLNQVPLTEITNEFLLILKKVSVSVDEANIPALSASLLETSKKLQEQMDNLTLVEQDLRVALQEYTKLGQNINANLPSTLAEAKSLSAELKKLSASAGKAFQTADALLQEDSAPMLELSQTMQALRDASNAITNLATLLEIQPNSLILGKGKP